MFHKGASSSTLNLARSAISFFCSNVLCLKDNPIILRLFQYFYKKRPLNVKYFTYWTVRQLLDYLVKLHLSAELNLKLLTIKTLTLITLSSSDRGQTLHPMKIDNVPESFTGIDFVIFDPIKTTKRVLKPKIISCITTENEALNVCHYVKEYMTRTSPLREEAVSKGNEMPKQLFLSRVTKKPVTK